MPATDLPLLIDAVRMAGRVATSFAGPSAMRWDKPDDAGPVTEADIAVNDILHSTLTTARPDYGWLSEESTDGGTRLDRERVFIVDPIDGTRSFCEGSRTWAISVAVTEAGRSVAAAVYLPLRDKLYAAAAGAGTTLNGAPVVLADRGLTPRARVLAARPNLDQKHWSGTVPDLDRHYRPSLAYRMSLVSEGRFDGMLTLRPSWEWDIAAGALLVSEAGGAVTDRTGRALRFNNPVPKLNGVIAAAPRLHRDLVRRLAPAPA